MLGTDDPLPSGQGIVALSPGLFTPQPEWSLGNADEVDHVVRGTFGSQRVGLRRLLVKLFRYGATSAIALGISEIALVVAAAGGITATLSALIGNLAGVIPSYLMSRYWIWAEASRERVGRQVIQYWITSLVSMAITSLATGAISSLAPSTGDGHLIAVSGGFLFVNFVCWIGKYVVYQRLIFAEAPKV